MAHQIAVTPIIGLPTYAGWSQVVVARTDTNITAVIAVAIEGEGAASIGSHLVTAIKDNPPRSAEALYHLFEESVLNIVELGCTCSMSGGVFRPGRSIVAAYDGAVALKRDRTIAPILSAQTQIELLQGRSQLDDVYIFSTSDAREFLPGITLTFEKGYDTDSVVTTIVPSLHGKEDSSMAAIGFAEVVDSLESSEDAAESDLPTPQETQHDVQPEMEEPAVHPPEHSAPIADDIDDMSVHHVDTQRPQEQVSREPSPQGQEQPVLEQSELPVSTQSLDAQSPRPRTTPRPTLSISRVVQNLKHVAQLIGRGVSSALTTSAGILRWLLAYIHKLIFPNKYVEYKQLHRVRLIVLAILVILVIGISAWLVIRMRSNQLSEAAAATMLPYRERIETIRSTSESDLLKAREDAEVLLQELYALQSTASDANNKQLRSAADEVVMDAEQLVSDISGREELAELPIAFDLRSVQDDFLTSGLYALGERLFAFDREAKRGLLVDVTTGSATPADMGDLTEIRGIAQAQSEELLYVLSEGIQSIALQDSATAQAVIPEGDSNRQATQIASFGSFVYVLNPERRNIYRYVQSSEGFSEPIGWLTGPLGISFEEVNSWVIDGDIWIGTQDGRIRKYTTGRQAEFEISGLEQPFSGRLHLFTTPESENLYVLEPDRQRIVQLNKQGQFIRQVAHVTLASATGFVVSEGQNTIYVASGSTIFSIPLVY